jgi:hypothetical protein
MLAGMKKSSESYWTESITSEEINQEDFLKTREVSFEEDKVLHKAVKRSAKVVDKGKLLAPKGKLVPAPEKKIEETKVVKKQKVTMASLENFFEVHEEAPENKKRKKRV